MRKYAVRDRVTKELDKELVDFPMLTRQLLFHRGFDTKEKAQRFISPDYDNHSHDALLLKDAKKAAERIWKAILLNERVIVYSDYDADGIPAAVIFHDFFVKIGFKNFRNYIPHRHNEGFGLHHEAILEFEKEKASLIITLDCGIADVSEVAAAQEKGIDVIITDHHLPGDVLPKAFAIVNPKQADCDYPEKMLCGAGVAFKLIQALLKTVPQEQDLKRAGVLMPTIVGWEKWLIDMAGIGTMSDMVPLLGENRVFAHFGLKVLRKSPRVGLMKLLRKLKTDQRYITEDDIGFTISPRINAASRMGVPYDAFRLLSTTDEDEADRLSTHLNEINDERKGVVAAITKEVRAIIRERYADTPREVIVIGNPKWKPTLLGLVASALMDDHTRPVFLWGRETGATLKGSCRSDGSVDVTALMAESRDMFIEYGGHALSGGFAVVQDKVHLLEESLNVAYQKVRIAQEAPILHVDARLSLEQVNPEIYRQVDMLSPFGVGNPKPVFLFENVTPVSVKAFGKQKNHLELAFKKSDGRLVKAIGFFMTPSDLSKEPKEGGTLSLLATLEKSMFRSYPEYRLRIIDVV